MGKTKGLENYTEVEKDTIINFICERIAEGMAWHKALKCPHDNKTDMIDRTTFYRWLTDNLSYSNSYKQACEIRHDILAEQALVRASRTRKGTITKMTPKGMIIEEHDNVPRSRLEFNATQWYLSKVNPTKYGSTPATGQDHIEQVLFDDID